MSSASKESEILASVDGKVMISKQVGGYGNVVFIDHGEGIVIIYAHCSKLLVEEGRKVKDGDKIAKIGSCLYFEVRVNGSLRLLKSCKSSAF